MTIHNRDSFLDKVANRLGRSRRTDGVERPQWPVQPQDDVFAGKSQEELIDVLKKQCEAIHTTFKHCNLEQLQDVLGETVDSYKGKKIIASNDSRNTAFGLDRFYEAFNYDDHQVHLWSPEAGNENVRFAEQADVGISFSDITLAESGTVTLFSSSKHGRAISLMPRTYVAIIPKSTLVPRMTQAVRKIHADHNAGQDVASCVSFVTGPSNSADIEMKLIVGVHGPVEVTYIVIDDK